MAARGRDVAARKATNSGTIASRTLCLLWVIAANAYISESLAWGTMGREAQIKFKFARREENAGMANKSLKRASCRRAAIAASINDSGLGEIDVSRIWSWSVVTFDNVWM